MKTELKCEGHIQFFVLVKNYYFDRDEGQVDLNPFLIYLRSGFLHYYAMHAFPILKHAAMY